MRFMRSIRHSCLLCIFCALGSAAVAQESNCEMVGTANAVDQSSDKFRDVLGDTTTTTGSLTLGCSGHFGALSFDAAVHKSSGETPDLRVRDIKLSWDIGENAHLILGYNQQNSDPSFALQPIGLFGDSNDYARFTDRTYERESSVMARLEYYFEDAIFSSSISQNRRYGLDSTQWVNSFAFSVGNTDAQVLARYDDTLGAGLGMGFTTIIGNNFELHGSFFAQKGSARLYHADAISGTLQLRAANDSPIGRHRLNTDTIFPKVVLGGHYTFSNGDNWLLEFVHDGEGMTSSEWQNYVNIVDFHRTASAPLVARAGNLGFDLQALGNANMQNYVFSRYSITRTKVDWSFSALVNTTDKSARLGVDGVYSVTENLDLYGEVSVSSGCDRCEFNLVPGGRSANIGLSYKF